MILVPQQRERALGSIDQAQHMAGGLIVQRGAGRGKPDTDARHQSIHHTQHRLGIGLADIAIARDIGQRRQRLHQLQHVTGQRGPVADRGDQRFHRLGQFGHQRILDQPGQGRQLVRLGCQLRDALGRRLADGAAPTPGID